MPPRSNLFQDVVAIIHAHMAEGATVEESALLRNRVTGRRREVDVVIQREAAGHTVTVGVEASSTGRPASVTWVEQMIGKHSDLPTDKLVLVSETGFTPQAREYAEAKGVVALAPEDLTSDDPSFVVVNRLRSIWPKSVVLTPTRAPRVAVRRPDDELKWFRAMPDHMLFFGDGSVAGTVEDVVRAFFEGAELLWLWERLGLASIERSTTKEFMFPVGPNPPLAVHTQDDERSRQLYARWELASYTVRVRWS
jgi:hypothetical protein